VYLISKIAIAFISPLGTACFLATIALLFCASGSRRWALRVGTAAVLWLWLWSMPVVSAWLLSQLERDSPVVPIEATAVAQAIVVLGGAIRPPIALNDWPDLGPAADRVWHAARLYHAGKSSLLVLSGSTDQAVHTRSEANAMQTFLQHLGVPKTATLLEDASRNTQENASFTANLLNQRGINHVLLVTSALHMPRAVTHFEAQGLQVTPAATDHSHQTMYGLMAWLPDARALEDSSRGLKEVIGRMLLRVSL
jgi:uncharacterized SAM-binding protein YcdF (DUF218 family)